MQKRGVGSRVLSLQLEGSTGKVRSTRCFSERSEEGPLANTDWEAVLSIRDAVREGTKQEWEEMKGATRTKCKDGDGK